MAKFHILPKPVYERYADGYCTDSQNEQITVSQHLEKQEYRLIITPQEISITAGDEAGVFYARQTLKQLKTENGFPCCEIHDRPQYLWRGFMIDSCRHMQSMEEIKTYIEAAAMMKMNIFHWHLTDDQGWRFESERHTKLNEIGSYRDGSDFGQVHKRERYGGYYAKAQMKEIVDFCAERFITVVPELELPGHSTAALASYPELGCTGEQVSVETMQGVFKTVLCAGKESTFTFICDILDELCEVFPGPYIHIGGDEAPKDRWKDCPHCQNRMKELHLTDWEQLQGDLTNRVTSYLATKGRTAIVWNESLHADNLEKNVIVQNWMDKKKECSAFAKNGGKVIASDFYHYYLDYPYAMTPLRKTFLFEPVTKGIPLCARKQIFGVEAPIWTEYIDNFSHLCYMCFPRLAAVAMSGWCFEKGSYREFEKRIQTMLPLWQSVGVIPAPQKEWNPGKFGRLKGTFDFFSGVVNRTVVHRSLWDE